MKHIRKMPKYIIEKIRKIDEQKCPKPDGHLRFYAYLAIWNKELVKVTVAVKHRYKKWYCKQVAVHGLSWSKCYVKDMEYCYYNGMGFRVGWHAEGLTKFPSWYEDNKWCDADNKYYDPYALIVNRELIAQIPEFKYSAYELYEGVDILQYLRLYKKFPQTEYLLKLGLHRIVKSTIILKRIGTDKKFRKWLAVNRSELSARYYYIVSIMRSYKTGKPLSQVQAYEQAKKRIQADNSLKPLKELFKKDLEQFFLYIGNQNSSPHSYLDYAKACNYLGLDMTVNKNRFPHNFRRWHDIRIDEYHSAKVKADEKERAEMYKQFAAVAEKYMALQNCKKGSYAVFIAKSPAELMQEGDALKHCVGRMNYDQKFIREETLIFFVRQTDAPDNPFVTVEYSLKSKKVLQCYGDGSQKPDDVVLNFVNKVWLPYANRKIKKLAA